MAIRSRTTETRLGRLEESCLTPHARRERDLMARLALRLETWAADFVHRNPATEPTEFPATALADFLWEPAAAGTALAKYREGDAANLEGTILALGKVIFLTEERRALHRAGWRDPRWKHVRHAPPVAST